MELQLTERYAITALLDSNAQLDKRGARLPHFNTGAVGYLIRRVSTCSLKIWRRMKFASLTHMFFHHSHSKRLSWSF